MRTGVPFLPGNGIGPAVTREAVRGLRRVADKFHHAVTLAGGLRGGIAMHKTGTPPFPEETARLAKAVCAAI